MQPCKIIIIMGSKRDFDFASRIQKFLRDEKFDVKCEYLVASAHKTPRRLMEIIDSCEETRGQFVFITVAGLSDALSGVVAGSSKYPVIACPPDAEKYRWAKIFSSTVTPKGVSVTFIPRPENAALAALKILALSNESLQNHVSKYLEKLKASVIEGANKYIGGRKDE